MHQLPALQALLSVQHGFSGPVQPERAARRHALQAGVPPLLAACSASRLAVDLVTASGELTSSASLSASTQLSSTQLLLTEAAVAALSADGSQLCSAKLQQGGSLTCKPLASLLPPGTATGGARLLPGTCSQHAALRVAGGAAVLALGTSSGAAATAFVPGAASSGCFPGAAGGQQVAFAVPSAAGMQTQVLSAADGATVEAPSSVAALAPRRVGGELVGVAELFAAPLNIGGSQAVRWEQLLPVRSANGAAGRQAALLPRSIRHPSNRGLLAEHPCSGLPHQPGPPVPTAAASWRCLRTTAWCWCAAASRPGCATRSWPPSGVSGGAGLPGWRPPAARRGAASLPLALHAERSALQPWAAVSPPAVIAGAAWPAPARTQPSAPPCPPRPPAPADLLFTDLPAPTPENEAQWLASQPHLRESLAAQLVALKVQASSVGNLALASPEELRQLEQYKRVTSDKLRPTRDPGAGRGACRRRRVLGPSPGSPV